jgi:hypothetical protein
MTGLLPGAGVARDDTSVRGTANAQTQDPPSPVLSARPSCAVSWGRDRLTSRLEGHRPTLSVTECHREAWNRVIGALKRLCVIE